MTAAASAAMMMRGSCCKRIVLSIIVIVIGINLILLVRKFILANSCDLGNMLAQKGLPENFLEAVPETTDDNCQPGVPCEYPDSVDLRIIVLTYNRWQSLLKLLNSLNDLKFDGDRVSMEIWIDRSAGPNGLPDQSTVVCARSFRWRHGDVRVHVQKRHVGIYGQWIDTWKPVQASQRSKNETDELVLILEDDLTVSPFAYRWLKAAHRFYSNRTDLAGFTLQSEGLIVASNGAPFNPNRQKTGPSYMYALLGSWGFSPNPDVWRRFQDWYHRVSKDRNFKPYVNGLIMTRWYKDFERRGTSNSMWTMWFIYFCEQNRLYTVYNNISLLMNSTTKGCLAINRREPGLHFQGKANVNTACLSWDWSDAYVDFREPVGIYGFDGKPTMISHFRSSQFDLSRYNFSEGSVCHL